MDNTLLIPQMFRSMIFHATKMAQAVLNQDHTYLMVISGMVHVIAITALIEVEANCRDASVTVMVIVRVAIRCHVGTEDHPII